MRMDYIVTIVKYIDANVKVNGNKCFQKEQFTNYKMLDNMWNETCLCAQSECKYRECATLKT